MQQVQYEYVVHHQLLSYLLVPGTLDTYLLVRSKYTHTVFISLLKKPHSFLNSHKERKKQCTKEDSISTSLLPITNSNFGSCFIIWYFFFTTLAYDLYCSRGGYNPFVCLYFYNQVSLIDSEMQVLLRS